MYGLLRDQGSLFVQVRQHYSAVSPLLSTVLPAFKQKIRPAPEFFPQTASEFFPAALPKKTRSLPAFWGEWAHGLARLSAFGCGLFPSVRANSRESFMLWGAPSLRAMRLPSGSAPGSRSPLPTGRAASAQITKFQGRSPPSKGLSGSSSFLRRSLLAQITREMTTRPLSSST